MRSPARKLGVADSGSQMSRRRFLRSTGMAVLVASGASLAAACASSDSTPARESATTGRAATLYRQEGCSCCATYGDYLDENGFTVDMKTLDDLQPIRDRHRIPDAAVGCHTSLIGGYVVEGHVPVAAITRLLAERSDLDGISVVGMPTNSPGMGPPGAEPLEVVSFRGGQVEPFMAVDTF